MMSIEVVTESEMSAHVAAGAAVALLPDGPPGPVMWHDRWWAIPVGSEDYRPVDAESAAELDRHAQRLAQARADLAR